MKLGNWKTKSIPAANWNDEFLAPVREGIDKAFAKIHDESCEMFKAELAQAIKEIMTALNLKLKSKSTVKNLRKVCPDVSMTDDPQALVCDAYKKCFLDNLEMCEHGIARAVETFAKKLQQFFRYLP